MKIIKLWKGIVLSIVVGIIVGIFTVLGQGILPGNWNSLANSGAVWLLPAFFIGALGSTKTQAAIFSIISLLFMVSGYYAGVILIKNITVGSINYIILWSVIAIIGGAIFGVAGFLWGRDKGSLHKFGSAIIGGVFISEGLNIFMHISDYGHMLNVGLLEIIGGIFLILVLESSRKRRFSSLLALLPIIVLGIVGYQILYHISL